MKLARSRERLHAERVKFATMTLQAIHLKGGDLGAVFLRGLEAVSEHDLRRNEMRSRRSTDVQLAPLVDVVHGILRSAALGVERRPQ